MILVILLLAVIITGALFILNSENQSEEEIMTPEEEYLQTLNMTDQELEKFISEKLDFCVKKNSHPYDLAISSLDESLCKRTEEQENCIAEIKGIRSINKNDKSLCKDIRIKSYRDFCLSVHEEGISACSALEGSRELSCRAILSNDESYCYEISDEDESLVCRSLLGSNVYLSDYRNDCLPYIEVDLDSFQGEVPDCTKVITSSAKELCIRNRHLQYLSDATQERCDEITDPEIKKACQSIINLDHMGCSTVQDKDIKHLCAVEISMSLGNLEGCNNYNDPEIKEACINKV